MGSVRALSQPPGYTTLWNLASKSELTGFLIASTFHTVELDVIAGPIVEPMHGLGIFVFEFGGYPYRNPGVAPGGIDQQSSEVVDIAPF